MLNETTSQLPCGELRGISLSLLMKMYKYARNTTAITQYAQTGMMSNHVSASFRESIFPAMSAIVLLVKCISIVSFRDPVL